MLKIQQFADIYEIFMAKRVYICLINLARVMKFAIKAFQIIIIIATPSFHADIELFLVIY